MFGPVLRLPPDLSATRARSIARQIWTTVLLATVVQGASSNARAGNPDEDPATSRSGPLTRAAPLPDDETLERVARDPIWLALLHQARRSIDRRTRAALAETHFFYHVDGATRPGLELRATLSAFQSPDLARAQSERCRFPARHQFLAERDLVPVERGPCPELDTWRERIGDVELTLAFPEAFLGNPASMFGHTLLRFDPVVAEGTERGPRPADLLGWTLDYTADATDEVSAIYLVRGLLGAYRGRFGISPYYEKTKQYGDWQDRDIWEFPLDMPAAGRERVLLHIWELREVTLPYYFFTQNCSEKLLEVLEVGWPDLGRGGGFPPTVTPVDTLRAMAAASEGAVGRPHLRTSPATQIQESLAEMGPAQADLVEALSAGEIEPDAAALDQLTAADRARVLTLAYDLLRHRFLAHEISAEESRPRSIALLRVRSQISVPPERPSELRHLDRVPPNEGHGTSRVVLSGGLQDREGFVELRAMPAYHTGLDAPGGFAEGGEIKLLNTALRYYPELDRVRLHELVVLDITTASPWRRPFRPLGWHSEIGVRTRLVSSDRDRGLDTESVFRAQGGLGAAWAPARRLHLYAFGEVVLEAGPGLEGDAVTGPLARAGMSWSTAEGGYTFRIEGIAGALAGKDSSEWLGLKLEQRVSITKKWSAVLGGHFERAYDVGHFEARFGLTRYF